MVSWVAGKILQRKGFIMRVLSLFALTVALSLAGAAGAAAQSTKDKDKKPEWPKEIGGKTAEEWIKAIAQPDRSKSVQAMKTILLFGPEKSLPAVPVILSELKKHKGGT